MLLNEFLKEHKAFVEEQRKVHAQGASIARLEHQIEALTAGLQKVSTHCETSKFARRAAGRIRRGGPSTRLASTISH